MGTLTIVGEMILNEHVGVFVWTLSETEWNYNGCHEFFVFWVEWRQHR